MKRKPSASPVCYADEKGIDPAYMWAQHPKPKAAPKPKRTARKTTKQGIKR